TTLASVLGVATLVVLHLSALSRRTECANNLRQIGMAANRHHDANGAFPAAGLAAPGVPPERRLSWLAVLLPEIGEQRRARRAYQGLAGKPDRQSPWASEATRAARDAPLRVFRCPGPPDDPPPPRPGRSHYVGVCGIGPGAIDLPREHPRAGLFGYD